MLTRVKTSDQFWPKELLPCFAIQFQSRTVSNLLFAIWGSQLATETIKACFNSIESSNALKT